MCMYSTACLLYPIVSLETVITLQKFVSSPLAVVVVSWTQGTTAVDEGSGAVSVCAEIVDGQLGVSANVALSTTSESAFDSGRVAT